MRAFPNPEIFAPVPNPAFYVPREATERCLGDLEAAILEGRPATLLEGREGHGRSMLLRVVERRLAERVRFVALPYAALPPGDLFGLVLSALHLDDTRNPERTLLAAALRSESEERPLVIGVVEGNVLPLATASALGRLAREAEGAVRVVVRLDSDRAERVREALGLPCHTVSLDAPMSMEETAAFVRGRLEQGRAPTALRLRFHRQTVEDLHRRAEGVPLRVNELAQAIVDGTLDPPSEHSAARSKLDPFGPVSAPRWYHPREACEAALEDLVTALDEDRLLIDLHGPSGIGKTALLRVLYQRLKAPYYATLVPFTSLEPDDFFELVLEQAGMRGEDDAESGFDELVEQSRRVGGSLVLLTDDANSMPDETRKKLVDKVRQHAPALRLVFARTPSATGVDRIRELDGVHRVALAAPMTLDETRSYVHARLDEAQVSENVLQRFDEGTVRDLHASAQGLPREINRLASEIERAGAEDHDWLEPVDATTEEGPEPEAVTIIPARRPAPVPAEERRSAWLATTVTIAILGALLGLWLMLGPVFETGPSAPEPVFRVLRIEARPPALVSVDGIPLGATPIEARIELGSRLFRLEFEDGRIEDRVYSVQPSDRRLLFTPAPEAAR